MQQQETFPARLRRLREARGLSKSALARAVGCTETEIRHLENGRTEWPNLLTGLRIAEALVEDPVYLATGLTLAVWKRRRTEP